VTTNYYSIERGDILELLPRGVQHLLDVGCGEGVTGASAKKLCGVQEVVGIEFFEPAARKAVENLDRVIIGDVETLELDFPPGYFDCIVCADVLEHTRDPWIVLKKLRPLLSDNGVLIASIPNIRNVIPILKILTDRFEYEDSNILDRTHLRFFTLHTIKLLFRETGFTIIRTLPEHYRSWKFILFHIATLGLLWRFSIYRYKTIAVKDQRPDSKQAVASTL
jgi:2-polyprenyl-3-methyl-5-hydroxy-6-metoxy-1,4-benzoquinol methylase